jgi:transcriptional regulator with XRE-family HTH domain
MTPEEFIAYLTEQVDAYGSQLAFARHYGVSPSYLSDVMRRKREPGPSMLHALGFRKVVTYKRISKGGEP